MMHMSDDTMRAIKDARIARLRGEQRSRSRQPEQQRNRYAR
jgi:hypothetical protein